MDVTPHLVTGAAIAVRVKRPTVAMLLAFGSHFVLDAIPHFHLAWIDGQVLLETIDIALGLVLTGVIAWRAGSLWPFLGAVVAMLPDAPGLRGTPLTTTLPHPEWGPPWGVATQVIVAGSAFLWGMQRVARAPRAMGHWREAGAARSE